MFVHVTNHQENFHIDPKEVESIVACILQERGVTCDEVSIHFIDVEEISRLHEEYFNDPSPTDCITFPIDDTEEKGFYKVLGDVFICPDVALEYSQTHIVDFQEELTLYLVHGLLHLLGYDDIEEVDNQKMRREEAVCIQLLKERNLILSARSTSTVFQPM